MSDNDLGGFGKFVPGFDFLRQLTQGVSGGAGGMPSMGQWVAPTFDTEELDKRIQELKTVQFWLDQNAKALAVTIQALEVQRMTLATLKGMNVSLNEVAEAFKMPVAPAEPETASEPEASPDEEAAQVTPAATAESEEAETAPYESRPGGPAAAQATAGGNAAGIDPMQWWGSLTEQFQTIASNAMRDVAEQTSAMQAAVMPDNAAAAVARSWGEKGPAPAKPKAAAKSGTKAAAKTPAGAARKTAAKPTAKAPPDKRAD